MRLPVALQVFVDVNMHEAETQLLLVKKRAPNQGRNAESDKEKFLIPHRYATAAWHMKTCSFKVLPRYHGTKYVLGNENKGGFKSGV